MKKYLKQKHTLMAMSIIGKTEEETEKEEELPHTSVILYQSLNMKVILTQSVTVSM